MRKPFDITVKMKPPKIALELYPDNKKIQMLITLCKLLQRAVGKDSAFPLTTNDAGNLLEINPREISRWFSGLRADKIIELISKGHGRGTHGEASRYKYIGD